MLAGTCPPALPLRPQGRADLGAEGGGLDGTFVLLTCCSVPGLQHRLTDERAGQFTQISS